MTTTTMPPSTPPNATTLRAPDLSDERIVRVVSGLRPCRRGGLRLDHESVGGTHIVHHYGHSGSGFTSAFGSAEVVADTAAAIDADAPVAVLGAGIAGLTAARALASRACTTTVYAERFAADTTSVIAGALWLPTGIELDTPDIGRDAFNAILRRSREIVRTLDATRFGVQEITVYEPDYAPTEHRYFRDTSIAPPTPLDRLPIPGPPRAGRYFETTFIHTPRMLRALHNDLTQRGVTFEHRPFASLDDVLALDEPIVVNATALGSRALFNDTSVFPARGILVHLEPQDLGYATHDGYKYMFPREDALLLGGCFQENVWDDTPDDEIAREILAHHRRFFAQSN